MTVRAAGLLAVVAALFACGDSDEPTDPDPPGPGAIHLTVATTGHTLDTTGYTARLNGTVVGQAALQDSIELGDLEPGSYTVELADVASNCAAQSASRTITLDADAHALADFQVQCDSALRNLILFTKYSGDGNVDGITAMAVRPDGTGLLPLFPGADPRVSPDGRFVVMIRFSPEWSIYRLNADGTALLDLTPDTAGDQFPVWSPDGTRIAFTSNRSGEWQLYTMRSDGSDQRRLTHSDLQESSPAWSPDGSHIAIARSAFGEPEEVVSVRVDGSDEDYLTDAAFGSFIPLDWSPDGSRLLLNGYDAFTTNHIWTINADGTALTDLTAGSDMSFALAYWAPDGRAVALDRGFDRGAENGYEILRIGLDRPDTTLLASTATPQFHQLNAWIP